MQHMDKVITATTVRRQLDAMGCDLFEVGVIDGTGRRSPLIEIWNKDTVKRSVEFLRSRNAQGCHIYIRPFGEHGLTLLDDLDAEAVERMKADGFAPAAVVETSPGNFQVWMKHGQVIGSGLSTECAKELARHYGGDPGSAHWRHFSRLAGFTNRKEQHLKPGGQYPLVRLRSYKGRVYKHAAEFIDEVSKLHERRLADDLSRRRALIAHAGGGCRLKIIEDFWRDLRYEDDYSRADLAYAMYALSSEVSREAVEQALRTRDLSHKGNEARQQEYIDRTIDKAAALIRERGLS